MAGLSVFVLRCLSVRCNGAQFGAEGYANRQVICKLGSSESPGGGLWSNCSRQIRRDDAGQHDPVEGTGPADAGDPGGDFRDVAQVKQVCAD